MRKDYANSLFISDLQLPFAHEYALEFSKAVQKDYNVPSENVYNVGDECDLYGFSGYKKNPDAEFTPRQELIVVRRELKRWYKAFPKMKLAVSNHGLRYIKKAIEAEIPSQVLKEYRDIIGAPAGWQWKEKWTINAGLEKINLIHGMGYSSQRGHINAAIDAGMNTVIGHLHSHAGINYLNTDGREIWAANAGCLIDRESYAFSYGKYNRNKPVLSVLVVANGGTMPILVPMKGYR